MKWKTLTTALLGSVLLAACGDVPPESTGPEPYEQVAEIISLADYLPEDIHANYTEEGQMRLRMAFPDENHKAIALKQIGARVPDLTLETLGGAVSLRELTGERVLIHVTTTSASVAAEMAPELAQHVQENEMRVLHLYPNDTEAAIKAFHDENNLPFDKDTIIAGNNSAASQAAVTAFGSAYVPTLLYVDETGTISYLSIGFRDAVLLQDNYDAAFEGDKLYSYLSGYETDTTEE